MTAVARRQPAALLMVLAVVGLSFGAGATASRALITDQETAASTFTSGNWGTTATISIEPRDVRDSSSGTETNASDEFSYADGAVQNSTNWAKSFSATRYLQWDYNQPMPAGQTVTSASFSFRFIPNAGGETGCYYFEVRKASDDSLLGTHGSTGSPVACHTGTTYTTFTTSLPEITTSDLANDVRIKLFGDEDNAKPFKIDLATVSATTSAGTWTMYQGVFVDAADGSAVSTTWSLALADGVFFLPGSNFPTAFSATRYVTFGLDPWVPASATVSAANLTVVYQSATSGPTSCFYYEVYSSGGSLLGTHGNSGSPESCHTGNASWTTYTAALSEVASPADANGVQIKMYWRNTGSNKPRIDQVQLTLTYTF